MADLIDRDALMKKICGNVCGSVCDEECENAMCNFYDYIMDAPAVNRWISVEDALPEESGTYLVWFEYYIYGDYDGMYATHGIGSFYHGRWAFINRETGWQSLRVIAWMPLPEPPEKE